MKRWEITSIEEEVKAYILDDNSYLTDYSPSEDAFVLIFKGSGKRTKVVSKKKSEYKKYFRRKTYIPCEILSIALRHNDSYFDLDSFLVLVNKGDNFSKELTKLNKALEDKEKVELELNSLKERVKSNITALNRKLTSINFNQLSTKELKELETFSASILTSLDKGSYTLDSSYSNNIIGIKEKKLERIENYKEKIDSYLLSYKGEKVKVVDICKALGINRSTFYNLKLNEYLKYIKLEGSSCYKRD